MSARTTTPAKRRCRACGGLAPEAELERVGTTESKPGWCGGPRQDGRPIFVHPACIVAAEEAAQRDRDRDAERLRLVAEARAARDAGNRAEYDRLLNIAAEL